MFSRLISIVLLLCLSTFPAFSYEAKDALGRVFEFNSQPKVATLVPSITESVFAIGAGNFLIANSRYCRIPIEARNIEKIGGYLDPDYEKILRIKPDIFLVQNGADSRLKDSIERIGVKCFMLNKEGYENISKDIILLGRLFDRNAEAQKAVENIKKSELEAKERVHRAETQGAKRPNAVFMFGKMAAGKGSYVGDLMEIAGFKNAAKIAGKPWFVPAKEFFISANVDVIFVEIDDNNDIEHIINFYKSNPVWRYTPAVKEGRIFPIRNDIVSFPGPRVGEALKILSDIFVECVSN